MALLLILLAYAKIILEEEECQTEDNVIMNSAGDQFHKIMDTINKIINPINTVLNTVLFKLVILL